MAKKNIKQQEQNKNKTVNRPANKSVTLHQPFWLKNSGAFFLITLVTFVLYFNSIAHDYAVDDAIVITDNMFTQQGAKGIKKMRQSFLTKRVDEV